ncbi:hypothetical protein HYALB_00009915 [Hymenoscyphus albidus]|uniref:Uncharacterized protein n=1 Tax=Hymenoscyphus albidus TaxID=595503 RepID=A0A9N9LR25_9HELO|nr:hypothetical protein HYALB_00009915 [Hymenoscyphus albidus]
MASLRASKESWNTGKVERTIVLTMKNNKFRTGRTVRRKWKGACKPMHYTLQGWTYSALLSNERQGTESVNPDS